MKVKLDLFAAGYCTNFERMVNRKAKLQPMKFPAICSLIKHPVHGYILFDTGYSNSVLEGTKTFPMNLYMFMTPIHFEDGDSAAQQLESRGVAPEEVMYVILSHFHIDHMGGLSDFPNATYLFSSEAYNASRGLKGINALLSAYMKELEPPDFEERSMVIQDFESALPYKDFNRGNDLFDDGSIIAVELPGHAPGQLGLFIQTETQTVLLAADASWTSQAIREIHLPSLVTKMIIHDYPAFVETLQKLHRLHLQRPDIKIIPSHCQEVLCFSSF